MTVGPNGPGAVALGATDRAAASGAIKALLRITTGGEDALIGALADTALGIAEAFTGQVTVARTMTATFPPGDGWCALGAGPVTAIASAARRGADGTVTALPVGGYAVDIDADGIGWVRIDAPGDGEVVMEFTAGLAADWAGLPAPIRQGAAMLAAHLFANREGEELPPAAVTALWRPFRTLRLANGVRR